MAWIRSHIFYGERPNFRAADGVLNHGANFFVTSFLADDAVAKQHTAGVGVDDKYRMVAGVKQDGISGFRTYPGEFHYFTREHVLRDAWTRVDAFFGKWLKPERGPSGSR